MAGLDTKLILVGAVLIGGWYILSGKRTVALSYSPTAPDMGNPPPIKTATSDIFSLLTTLWGATSPGILTNQIGARFNLW